MALPRPDGRCRSPPADWPTKASGPPNSRLDCGKLEACSASPAALADSLARTIDAIFAAQPLARRTPPGSQDGDASEVGAGRVAILLSTYNGERFLPSSSPACGADARDWRLYWRDDGSADGTPRPGA